jgi:dihydroorotase-like cyclic amidohydrolase
VSTHDDINLIKLAKMKGLKITCDAAPHHLFLSKQNATVQEGFNGSIDLKDETDRQALWDNIDSIDIISSDRTYSLELTLTLMLTACKQGRISLDAVIDKLNTNPRRIFNLPEQRDCHIEAGEL